MLSISPPTHYIALSSKYFSQATDNHVCVGQDMHVDEVSDRLVNNHGEIIAIRKGSNPANIRGFKERVAGEFAEQSEVSFTSFTPPFQVVKIRR